MTEGGERHPRVAINPEEAASPSRGISEFRIPPGALCLLPHFAILTPALRRLGGTPD